MKIALLLVAVIVSITAFGQDKAPAMKSGGPGKIRRDAAGRPDLSGIWQGFILCHFLKIRTIKKHKGLSMGAVNRHEFMLLIVTISYYS